MLWTIADPAEGQAHLTRVDGGEDRFEIEPLRYSLHGAVVEPSANYHLAANGILEALRQAYDPGEDGRWHRYTPDFVIRRKDGKHLIIEVKKDALDETRDFISVQ